MTLAAPREVRAQCLDPNNCVCTSIVQTPHAAFVATVLSAGSSGRIHIDTLTVRPGGSTMLAVGDEPLISTGPGSVTGGRVLGYATTSSCDVDEEKCVAGQEIVEIRSSFGQNGALACGFAGEVRLSEAQAITLILDEGCYYKMNDLLEQAGVDITCHDVGLCAAGGAPGTSGTRSPAGPIALGVAAIALVLARRRPR